MTEERRLQIEELVGELGFKAIAVELNNIALERLSSARKLRLADESQKYYALSGNLFSCIMRIAE